MSAASDSRFVRWVRRGALGVTVLLLLTGVGRLVQIAWDSHYAGPRQPYLQMVTADGITVRWQSGAREIGLVRYGTSPDRLDLSARESTRHLAHEIRLTGLQPDTRYYYAVGTAEAVYRGGVDYWFYTAPRRGSDGPTRLWIQGDPGWWHEGAQGVRKTMEAWTGQHARPGRPALDLWLTTGDNAYSAGRAREFQRALFEPYADMLRNIPYLPIYGNHDARRWTFLNTFTFPSKAEAGGLASGSRRYFSFDYANIHLVVLDSESGNLSPRSPMLRWLRADLAANRQVWTIALFHHPPYTHGSHNSDSWEDSWGRMVEVRANVLPLLEDGGVDLVLSGHSHVYERSHLLRCHYGDSSSLRPEMIADVGRGGPDLPYHKPRGSVPHGGTVYAVVGSTANLDRGPLDHPAHAVSLRELGSLLIDVAGERLDARFINVSGEVADQFSIVKSNDTVAPGRGCAE